MYSTGSCPTRDRPATLRASAAAQRTVCACATASTERPDGGGGDHLSARPTLIDCKRTVVEESSILLCSLSLHRAREHREVIIADRPQLHVSQCHVHKTWHSETRRGEARGMMRRAGMAGKPRSRCGGSREKKNKSEANCAGTGSHVFFRPRESAHPLLKAETLPVVLCLPCLPAPRLPCSSLRNQWRNQSPRLNSPLRNHH